MIRRFLVWLRGLRDEFGLDEKPAVAINCLPGDLIPHAFALIDSRNFDIIPPKTIEEAAACACSAIVRAVRGNPAMAASGQELSLTVGLPDAYAVGGHALPEKGLVVTLRIVPGLTITSGEAQREKALPAADSRMFAGVEFPVAEGSTHIS